MNVLIACEFSGVVREAFYNRGHYAISCDLLPCESGINFEEYHYQGDIKEFLKKTDIKFDLMVAHPPCTHLAVSGARWFKDKKKEQEEAIEFVEWLWNLDIPKICIENPVGVLSTKSKLGKATQYIQPWEFGHGETKKTGLWLKNLPKLTPTDIVDGREDRIHKLPPTEDRGKLRSITYTGIAKAMAEQWG